LVAPLFAVSVTVLVEAAADASPSTAATISGSAPGCSVTLHFSPTSVRAGVHGCTGGDYYLSSWSAPSDVPRLSRPQTLYASASSAPWEVSLPPCFWQVDFAQRSAPPGQPATVRHLIAATLGGTTCPTTTTTTVATTSTTLPVTSTTLPVTTTTIPQSTTTTTIPGTTTTTTAPGSGTTTTTLPPTITSVPGGGQTTPVTTVPTAELLQQSPPIATKAVSPGSHQLPFTGANSELLVAAGLVVLGTGGVLVYSATAGRRRKRRLS
jgi:hypothetical protein